MESKKNEEKEESKSKFIYRALLKTSVDQSAVQYII